ncbi:MAG TPA: carboxypeptidase-like regulatory domain-containing protein [Blastocatellia bacterium]|nr:carboxypeptidase-like regulatory domain-containing protein [Blastocatellia bacterium]
MTQATLTTTAVLLLASAFNSSAISLAQSARKARPTGQVYGVVTDLAEARIPRAEIIVENDRVKYTALTADDGTYRLELPIGTYNISVKGERGFCPARRAPFRVEPESTTKFDFILSVCPIVNKIIVENGKYKGEYCYLRAPLEEEAFLISSSSGTPLSLLIQYGERQQDDLFILYKGFRDSITYSLDGTTQTSERWMGVIVSYNTLTVRADVIRFDKKNLHLKAEGNVFVDDGKQRVEAKMVELKFRAGVPQISMK